MYYNVLYCFVLYCTNPVYLKKKKKKEKKSSFEIANMYNMIHISWHFRFDKPKQMHFLTL